MRPWQTLALKLAHEPAVLVRVETLQGSGPREVGAWMAVTARALVIVIPTIEPAASNARRW